MEVAIVGCSLCLSLFSVLSILKCLGSLLVLIIVRLMDGSFFFFICLFEVSRWCSIFFSSQSLGYVKFWGERESCLCASLLVRVSGFDLRWEFLL